MIAVSLSGRIRAGCSLALVVGLSAFGSVLLANVGSLRSHLHVAIVVIAAAGLVFLVRGQLKPMQLGGQIAEKGEALESYLLEHPLIFFRKIDYWGWILLVSALPIFFITKALYGSEVEPPKPLQQVVRVQESVTIEFPSLKLTGFVCNGLKSTAVIDGATVQVGGSIKGVTLVTVDTDGVVVEMNGNQKRLIQEESMSGNQPPRCKTR